MADLDWVERYRGERAQYKQFTLRLRHLLEFLLTAHGIDAKLEHRTKTVESFAEKLTRKGYGQPFAEMTDLSGLRVVLHTLDQVEHVGALIAQEFTIDRERSVRKSERLEPDRFGYLSDQYIVRIGPSRVGEPDWVPFADYAAELQVRTALQHAWAAVEHSLNYKTKTAIPQSLRRRLYRLGALFELADHEFADIAEQAGRLQREYKEGVRAEHLEVELNADSLRAYLEGSGVAAWWIKQLTLAEYLFEARPINSLHEIEMARRVGMQTLDDLNDFLTEAQAWGAQFLRCYHRTVAGRSDDSRSVASWSYLLYSLLVAGFPDVFTAEVLEQEFDVPHADRAVDAVRQARLG